MSLPYRPERDAVVPASLAGQPNGRLDQKLLAQCGMGSFLMAAPAARAMRAMVKAASRAGIKLWTTGTYRSFERQAVGFDGSDKNTWSSGINGRYVPEDMWAAYEATGRKWAVSDGKNDVRNWKGKRWKRRAGTAGSAVPGTSNHGMGTAIDLAEMGDGNKVLSLSRRTLDWLAANGPSFGFWNTVKSENWHWCWCLGDQAPAAVLAEETGTPVAPKPPVTPVKPVEPAKPVAPAAGTYVVQRGDSWWKIAQKVLGKGSRWEEIANLNGAVKTLKPGQAIRIPGGVAPAANVYVVVDGDSYWRIADRVLGDGNRWREVSDLNGGVALKPGMTLKIPGK